MNNTVFDRLVTASQSEGGKGLSDREIAGNLFIFFFAGVRLLLFYHSTSFTKNSHQHETTAHTLVAVLALLALHPGDQERVRSHILSVIGDSEPVRSYTFVCFPALLSV